MNFEYLFLGFDRDGLPMPGALHVHRIHWVFQLIGQKPGWKLVGIGEKSIGVIRTGLATIGLTPETEITQEMKVAIIAKAEKKLSGLADQREAKWSATFVFAAYQVAEAGPEQWIHFGGLLVVAKMYEEALRAYQLGDASPEILEAKADEIWDAGQVDGALKFYAVIFPEGIPDDKVVRSLAPRALATVFWKSFARFYTAAGDVQALTKSGVLAARLGNFVGSTHLFAAALRLTPGYALELNEPLESDENPHINPNLYKRIDELELSIRSLSFCAAVNFEFVYELAERTEDDLAKLARQKERYGITGAKRTVNEIKEILADLGISLGMKLPEGFQRFHEN